MTYAQGYYLAVFIGIIVAFGLAAFSVWSKRQEDKERQRVQTIRPRLTFGILPQGADGNQRSNDKARSEEQSLQEPTVWFASMEALSEVLSDENRALLKTMDMLKPTSISALATASQYKPRTLSRKLQVLAEYGLVELRSEAGQVRPVAVATEFQIQAR
jgi:predicted transcriptional regulator